jgi:hypothetical protein
MKKYFVGIAAMAFAVAAVGTSLKAESKANLATQFLFIGSTPSDYYVAAGWKVAAPSDPECVGTENPCLISHPTITTPAALATTLSTAGQGSIQADLTFRNATTLREKNL